MARIKYYYDTETCSFEKATWDGKTIFRTTLSYLLVSGFIAGLVVFYLFYLHDNPVTSRLRARNAELETNIKKFDTIIAQLEQDLEGLHEQDEKVYRAILKADPLNDEWAGGTGGKVAYKDLEPEALQETNDRLERILGKVNLQMSSYRALVNKAKENEDELQHMPSIRPIATDLISGFGYRHHPILKVRKFHTGLDFRAPVGTPIYATADGTVKHAGRGGNGYGIYLDIDHGFGYESKYAHLSKIAVDVGTRVKRGDIIAYSGNTGLSKGPHLHYEIKKDGEKIDPVDFFYSDLKPEQYVSFKKMARQYNESMD